MKAVVQVVGQAELSVEGELVSKIGKGLVVFFCVEKGDAEEKMQFFVKKIAKMRVFPDENGKTNLSIQEIGGQILFVSQFTLAGDCEHGNRPSFINAESPERAKTLYLECAKMLETESGVPVKLGVFGADMKINQVNDGPFTIILEK